MSRWFRLYDEMLDDPKVQRLAPHLFKTWVNLLCLASKENGKLPSNDDIAFRLRISVQDAAQQVEDLILAELIDLDPKGGRFPHGWEARQYASDTSAERMRKHRETKKKKACDVTGDGKVTVQNQIRTDSDTESIGLPSSPVAAREAEDQGFVKTFLKGRNDKGSERLTTRAEGLGLPVAEITEAVNRHKAQNRPAYFTTLCVQRLLTQLPGIDEGLIRDALWKPSDDAYKAVLQLLVSA